MLLSRRRSPLRTVEIGRDRCRIGPWRGDARLGYVTPLTRLSAGSVARIDRMLRDEGFRGVITGAVASGDRDAFTAAGYDVHERLHLLRHHLGEIPTDPRVSTRRGLRRHHRAVLELDRLAFEPFWHLDEAGLDEARDATPISRFRIVVDDAGSPTGYTVSGRAATGAYLQRLAVHPNHQRSGLGRALTIDALRWARRRRCSSMMVNTQERNERALRLYESLGFVRQNQGLFVMERFFGP